MNFYLHLTHEQAQNAKVKFSWTVEGEDKSAISVPEFDDETGCYKAICQISAAEMTYEITATLYLNEKSVDIDSYSAVRYADVILTDQDFINSFTIKNGAEKYRKLAELVKAMLDYGTKAQIQFVRDTEHPANVKLTETQTDSPYYYNPSDVNADNISTGASDMTNGLPEGLEYSGTTIVFLSETSMRHYYKGILGDVTVKFDGKDITPVAKGSEFYFEMKNISASNLDTLYTLQIGESEYQFSVLDYIKACLASDKVSPSIKSLAAATYLYNQAADDYFD